jgi:hypothetical protein
MARATNGGRIGTLEERNPGNNAPKTTFESFANVAAARDNSAVAYASFVYGSGV